MTEIPEPLSRELHPLCDRAIIVRILEVLEANPAVCIEEVARVVGCSDITAKKDLTKMVLAGLAIEKRIGKSRVFMKTTTPVVHRGDH
jgi:DeoR/GlpR family transcriptional regulator of sugar metabolism